MLTFEDITLSHQGKYLEFLRRSGTRASDYSFINLWGWASEDDISLAWDDDLVWIRQSTPSPCLWAPIGPWEIIDWQAVFKRVETRELTFTRVPEELLRLWDSALPGRVHAQEKREQWDYLYSVPELVELKGNRFHKKKNLLNQFKKKHPYRYQRIEPELIPRVLAMQEDWCAWRDCESMETLASENRVIKRVLNTWEQLIGIRGSALFIDERLVAFTVAEGPFGQTLLVHFEKGLTGYIGVYQAINQMFLEDTQGFTLVNREQDLGDEGLRAAKLSYNPVGYMKKYHVKIS
jgi:hypothetical protein